ncbi:MAG: hypothetical protein PHT78_12530 [Desulfitobacteriaceae bacterium]|nr:hypothetical protein [Desulfitobacteriaceae bacterium]
MENNHNVTGFNLVQSYEAVIKKLRGVLSSRVVLDKEGNFEEIHVLADMERNPKVIVRDIETAFMVSFGISLDHKKVSVVQMAEEQLELGGEVARPCLEGIGTSVSRSKVEAKISLSFKNKLVEGIAGGLNSPFNRMRVVAEAALDALAKLYEGRVTFAVDNIAKINFGGREIIAVSVFMVTPEVEELLLGTAFVKDDEQEAVGKAALGAVNRKLFQLNGKNK